MTQTTTSKDYGVITDPEQLKRLADKLLADARPIGFDLETGYSGPEVAKRSVDHYHPDQFVAGFSITNSTEWARYIPLRHDEVENIDNDKAWDAVREVLTYGDITAHNAKFERAGVRKSAGIVLGQHGQIVDTMLDMFNLGLKQRNYRTLVDLKGSVLELFGYEMMHIEDLWEDLPKNRKSKLRFNTLNPFDPAVYSYACEDSVYTLVLREHLHGQALSERGFITKLELKILEMIEEVELYGVAVDWEGLQVAQAQAQTFVPLYEQHVKDGLSKLAGRDLSDMNLRSAPQLKRLLFHDIGFTTTRMTKKGAEVAEGEMEDWQRMSSDKKSLVALAEEHEAIKTLLEYREIQNLTNRIKKWLTEYNQSFDGRVHANYKQAAAETNEDEGSTAPGSGRFSSGDPAIQQLPKKWKWVIDGEQANGTDHWAGNFRNFIVAAPDTYLLTYDYSQIELRVLAGASQEPELLKGFAADDDMHTLTAALMLGKDPFDIDEETERPIGKTFNFALMYGMGPKSLGEQLGIEFDQAKALYQEYFKVFSNVASYMNYLRQLGQTRGYAETIFGRKIPVWQLNHPSKGVQAQGARVLVNGPIQGSAADYMKLAMCRAYTELTKRGWWRNGCTVTMNQHDALTFEVSNALDPNEVREVLQPKIVYGEETIPVLKGYPNIKADWELGQRWGSSTKWSVDQQAAFVDGTWQIQPEQELKSLEIVLTEPPTERAYRNFLTTLKAAQGSSSVALMLPEGRIELPFTSCITKSSMKELRKIFRSATMNVA